MKQLTDHALNAPEAQDVKQDDAVKFSRADWSPEHVLAVQESTNKLRAFMERQGKEQCNE